MVCKMELMFKASALAVVAVVCSLLIKRINPEIAFLISLAAMLVIFASVIRFSEGLRSLRQTIDRFCGGEDMFISALMKCLGLSLVTKLSTDLCKDSGQTAIASSLEICGVFCALTVALPLLINVLGFIGGLY